MCFPCQAPHLFLRHLLGWLTCAQARTAPSRLSPAEPGPGQDSCFPQLWTGFRPSWGCCASWDCGSQHFPWRSAGFSSVPMSFLSLSALSTLAERWLDNTDGPLGIPRNWLRRFLYPSVSPCGAGTRLVYLCGAGTRIALTLVFPGCVPGGDGSPWPETASQPVSSTEPDHRDA